jgi:sulfatase maturation enzyme AslB (radical SAM superfamily)
MGPEGVMDFLEDLGVSEASFLPFMLNDQNAATGRYGEYAPPMAEWSDFMVAVTRRWAARRRAGGAPPTVGQMAFVLAQSERPPMANVAAQTLFLMPDGEFALPDYRDGWSEYMRPFGNILRQDFAEVLASPARRAYLRRQVTRNGNADCQACPHSGCCVMEFWKPNRPGDDCFGGRRYVEWLLANRAEIVGAAGIDAELF